MKKTINSIYFTFVLITAGLSLSITAQATPIDLNDFFADPTVTVALDGSSASFTEDPSLLSVLLSNDPGLGDPNVIIPSANTSLLFDYDFFESSAGDDEFGAFVIDGATGSSIPTFDFFTQDSSTGTVSFDLSSLVGDTLGLQFELSSLFADNDFDSTLTVSNVRLVTETSSSTVPEPSALLLFMIGLISLGWFSRLGRVK